MRNSVSENSTRTESDKRHYWLREDFDHLMGLLPAANREMPGDRSSSSSLAYPKYTEGAMRELRLRGLDCDGGLLERLADEGLVQPTLMAGSEGIRQWTKEDIDAAAEWLYNNERWSSWTHYCWVSNLRYGQCVKAFRVAAARFGLPFSLGFDPLGLVTVIEPAEDPDDYAYVQFFPKGTQVEPTGASQ